MNPSPQESFNARNCTAAQVAATFISNSDYEDLWLDEHTVMLGPRGSGKTTLFKMLTVPALYSWSDKMAVRLRSSRPFTAIYVPTDMHWHHQLSHAMDCLVASPRFSLAASRAAVTTSILLATARTLQERITFEAPNNLDAEAKLSEQLIREWMLPRTLPCLDTVVLALKSRIGEIRRIVNETIYKNLSDDAVVELPEYFHLDYLAQVDVGCTAFDSIYRLNQSRKWAICLDELELAPSWLQSLAFSQQRSTEETFLLKLSTSPIPRTLGTTESRPKQDVRLLCLWNYASRRGDGFDEGIARSILARRLGPEVTPESLLGKSALVLQSEDGAGKYEHGSAEWQLFKGLAEWDTSFRAILVRAGVDPGDPVAGDIAVRDSILRKAKPVAILRSAFMKTTIGERVLKRSRKLGTMYCGREALYRVADGNPRRLVGILGDLCAKVSSRRDVGLIHLAENEQAEILTRASYHFSGYVHALPGGNTSIEGNIIDLATLLKTIGRFFHDGLFGEHFSLDPSGSFLVDSNINDKVIELLRLGVYHGALVFVDPIPDTVETNLRGKRFRLSYMLSPMHKLPLTLNSAISLSSILRSSSRLRVKRALPAMMRHPELPLTFENENETKEHLPDK